MLPAIQRNGEALWMNVLTRLCFNKEGIEQWIDCNNFDVEVNSRYIALMLTKITFSSGYWP